MLNFQDFFTNCAGFWKTERIYHFLLKGDIERSYTEFRADSLDAAQKQQMLKTASPSGELAGIRLDLDQAALSHNCPGFAISFDTESERGEKVSMSLKALFVPDALVLHADERYQGLALPAAAQVSTAPESEVIQGFYLRDEGYSEAGAIAGRFTYQPIRQTLEMTTFYSRSVAVDQMRFIAPDVRMRTIVTYQRPPAGETPTVIDLIGFGVERKS
ncbi:phycobiliprotein lyase [Thermoleptolyngbya sp. PKUAC-SCTB121]|uniref:phycobiliprotein lyase n=1 Tax=Thermoleptolyngbya sp. PKUAC-SCTB121 TaxID=2811482 RepID=UPI0019657512|nr:phycobiliprotein lyase [Thermoleptolyngbya sp. PKUAC-SCTB121]